MDCDGQEMETVLTAPHVDLLFMILFGETTGVETQLLKKSTISSASINDLNIVHRSHPPPPQEIDESTLTRLQLLSAECLTGCTRRVRTVWPMLHRQLTDRFNVLNSATLNGGSTGNLMLFLQALSPLRFPFIQEPMETCAFLDDVVVRVKGGAGMEKSVQKQNLCQALTTLLIGSFFELEPATLSDHFGITPSTSHCPQKTVSYAIRFLAGAEGFLADSTPQSLFIRFIQGLYDYSMKSARKEKPLLLVNCFGLCSTILALQQLLPNFPALANGYVEHVVKWMIRVGGGGEEHAFVLLSPLALLFHSYQTRFITQNAPLIFHQVQEIFPLLLALGGGGAADGSTAAGQIHQSTSKVPSPITTVHKDQKSLVHAVARICVLNEDKFMVPFAHCLFDQPTRTTTTKGGHGTQTGFEVSCFIMEALCHAFLSSDSTKLRLVRDDERFMSTVVSVVQNLMDRELVVRAVLLLPHLSINLLDRLTKFKVWCVSPPLRGCVHILMGE